MIIAVSVDHSIPLHIGCMLHTEADKAFLSGEKVGGNVKQRWSPRKQILRGVHLRLSVLDRPKMFVVEVEDNCGSVKKMK